MLVSQQYAEGMPCKRTNAGGNKSALRCLRASSPNPGQSTYIPESYPKRKPPPKLRTNASHHTRTSPRVVPALNFILAVFERRSSGWIRGADSSLVSLSTGLSGRGPGSREEEARVIAGYSGILVACSSTNRSLDSSAIHECQGSKRRDGAP